MSHRRIFFALQNALLDFRNCVHIEGFSKDSPACIIIEYVDLFDCETWGAFCSIATPAPCPLISFDSVEVSLALDRDERLLPRVQY